jgi:IS30 family transposase
MSDACRARLWQLWRAGKGYSEISRAIGYPPGSIFTVIRQTGGYVPAPRTRRRQYLCAAEREEISRCLARGDSLRAIARALGRAPSTISREVARNRGRRKYRAVDAEDRTWRRARRPQRCLLARRQRLRQLVEDKLRADWSPQQIAGYLRREHAGDPELQVSHETIYKSLFVQSRGVLAKELTKHLRSGRPTRRNIHHSVSGQWRSQISDAVSISERPPEVADRAVPGHWEGDLLLGRNLSQIATVVERSTRYTVLVHLAGRDMTSVTAALSTRMAQLPAEVRKSLTWDRGMELAGHKRVTAATGLQVYFADPRSPWQRGTNENTNRLLRQYFPKGTSLATFTQADLDAIADRLNTRPRKTLDYATPADKLATLLR